MHYQVGQKYRTLGGDTFKVHRVVTNMDGRIAFGDLHQKCGEVLKDLDYFPNGKYMLRIPTHFDLKELIHFPNEYLLEE